MGWLHDGHRRSWPVPAPNAGRRDDLRRPRQFGGQAISRYPRNEAMDVEACEAEGAWTW
jgi:hypothetical protein